MQCLQDTYYSPLPLGVVQPPTVRSNWAMRLGLSTCTILAAEARRIEVPDTDLRHAVRHRYADERDGLWYDQGKRGWTVDMKSLGKPRQMSQRPCRTPSSPESSLHQLSFEIASATLVASSKKPYSYCATQTPGVPLPASPLRPASLTCIAQISTFPPP